MLIDLINHLKTHCTTYFPVVKFQFKESECEHIQLRSASLLIQAVLNIIENAVYFSPEFVHITISVSPHLLTISIIDKGPGISKTIVNQLESFDSPILSDSNGVGLKLANFVIKKNNGLLKFIISNGTTAQITIPIFKDLQK